MVTLGLYQFKMYMLFIYLFIYLFILCVCVGLYKQSNPNLIMTQFTTSNPMDLSFSFCPLRPPYIPPPLPLFKPLLQLSLSLSLSLEGFIYEYTFTQSTFYAYISFYTFSDISQTLIEIIHLEVTGLVGWDYVDCSLHLLAQFSC